jgi:fibronectin-binding autotransporter adhesin
LGTSAGSAGTHLSLRAGLAKTATLNVGATGTVNINGNLVAPALTAGSAIVNVNAGGKIQFTGTGSAAGQCDISKATTTIAGTFDFFSVNTSIGSSTTGRSIGTATVTSTGTIKFKDNTYPPQGLGTGTITLDGGSTVEYYGATTYALPIAVTTYSNLTINNAAGVTLATPTTVTNALTLTAGNLTLGANDLTAGSFVGGTTSSHVIATGAGYLKSPMTAATAKVFPVGAPGISYDPVSISPANAVTCGAKVKDVMSNPVGNGDPTQVVKREWDLFTSAPQGTTDLVFTPDAMATDLAGGIYVLPVGAARVGHLTGGVWDTLVAVNCASGVWTVTGYGGTFSPFVVGSSLAILAIDLLNFTVKTAGTTNQLAWATATERNNTAFDIQRSPNGTDFTTISNVKGRGTTNTVSDYTFTDNTPLNGINYYRLRAVDMDGKATLSKNIAVINGTSKSDIVKVYPTVADAVLTVETISDESTTLKIMDIMGKTVLTKTLTATGFSSNPIDVSGLTNGLYILSFESATTRNTQKFIKN